MGLVTLADFGLPSWQELEDAYPRLADEVYARVAEWRFAPDAAVWELPQPLSAERQGRRPAKGLAEEPLDWLKAKRYGLDGDGAVLCAQSFCSGRGPHAPMHTESLAVQVAGRRVHLRFRMSSSPPPQLDRAIVEEHADGRLAGTTRFGPLPSDFCRERYGYDDQGRIVDIEVHHHQDFDGDANEYRTEERIDYAPDGSVKRVAEREIEPGRTRARFEWIDVAEDPDPELDRVLSALVTLADFGLPPWQELEDAYPRLVDEVHARVTEWRFASDTAAWEFPQPLWAERRGRRPAKALAKEPSDWSRAKRYGLDGDGAVVCAQSFVSGSGPDATLLSERLALRIAGLRVHLRFAVSSPTPRLEGVAIEEHADGRLVGTTQLDGVLQFDVHRERYAYDDQGRVIEILARNVMAGAIESWTEERITYAADGSVKRVSEREIKPGRAAGRFERVDVTDDEEQPVTPEQAQAARDRLEVSLADAVVAWHARVDPRGEITRILLLYDWPVNPPLPPGLGTRSDPLTPGEDWSEPFDPDTAEGILDADPPEFADEQFQADCDLLNAWYDDEDHDPVELLIAAAQRARAGIAERSGRDVWVMPVDLDRDGLLRAITAILPAQLQDAFGLPPQTRRP